jgi:hypothetical protein
MRGLGVRYRMDLPIGDVSAGYSSWPLADFDAFKDIAGKVVYAIPVFAAGTVSQDVSTAWNTYGQNRNICVNSPVAQAVYINLMVFYREG